MKLLLFGIGKFYREHREELAYLEDDTVVGFVDNRAADQRSFEGKPVYLPQELGSVLFDGIVLMSGAYGFGHALEMRDQLLQLGIESSRIYYYDQFMARYAMRHQTIYEGRMHPFQQQGKKLLIVAAPLIFGGGTLAIFFAATELAHRGWNITMAVSAGHPHLIASLQEAGVTVWKIPGLPFLSREQLASWREFDVALVNTFEHLRLACELRRILPTLWWIHESSIKNDPVYLHCLDVFSSYGSAECMAGLRIVAVSQRAANIFNKRFPARVDGVMTLGEPAPAQISFAAAHHPLRIVTIGWLGKIKGQEIFMQAVQALPQELRERCEFLLIGGDYLPSETSRHIRQMVEAIPQARWIDVMPRDELAKHFPSFDVIVCASLEETLSMTIVEGMMHGKVCITTETTGVAEFLQDGENGYIVKTADVKVLAERLVDVITNYDALLPLRQAARATYETHFSMQALGDRLEKELSRTKGF
ncbi:MAG: glycosyltransferase family 4 protein [Selenomonas bovis]|nr:glycosyltransferase family 4 protein [Selenomonas bovis]